MCSFKQCVYLDYILLLIPILIFIFYMSIENKNALLYR